MFWLSFLALYFNLQSTVQITCQVNNVDGKLIPCPPIYCQWMLWSLLLLSLFWYLAHNFLCTTLERFLFIRKWNIRLSATTNCLLCGIQKLYRSFQHFSFHLTSFTFYLKKAKILPSSQPYKHVFLVWIVFQMLRCIKFCFLYEHSFKKLHLEIW
jgi:hypothetical protein